jgi:hypothetical protein
MRSVRVGLLALMLVFSSVGNSQTVEPKKQLNVGVCAPGFFLGVHMEVTDKQVVFTRMSKGPGKNEETEPLVFIASVKDEDGTQHYKDKDGTYELALKFDKKEVKGLMFAEGEKWAKIYGAEADGKDLADDSLKNYQVCLDMQPSADQPDKTI